MKASDPCHPLAGRLRTLRKEQALSMQQVADACGLDLTLICKLEKGDRLPTAAQAETLAEFHGLDPSELEAARLAEKFWRENADNPAASGALVRMREMESEYRVNKTPPPARKSLKP